MSSSRSGRLSDLNFLVDRAKSSAAGGGDGRGGGGGSFEDDDASLASFSRSVARVARARDGGGGGGGGGGSVAGSVGGGPGPGGSVRSGATPRPPPPGGFDGPPPTGGNPDPYARRPSQGSVGSRRAHSTGRSNGSNGSGGSVSSRSSRGGSGRGASSRAGSRASRRSDATDRLLSLVNDLSRPQPPRGDPGGGYLPMQYGPGGYDDDSRRSGSRGRGDGRGVGGGSVASRSSRGGRSVGGPSRGGQSQRSRQSSVAADSMRSGATEPSGFEMPPMGGGAEGGSRALPPPPGGGSNYEGSRYDGTAEPDGGAYDAPSQYGGTGANSTYGGGSRSVGPNSVAHQSQGMNQNNQDPFHQSQMGQGTNQGMHVGGGDMTASVAGSTLAPSMMSATSAGQSTMPTEYNRGFFAGSVGGSAQGSNMGGQGGPVGMNVSSSASAPPGGSMNSANQMDAASMMSGSFASQPLNPGAAFGMMGGGMGGSMRSGMDGSGNGSQGTPPGSQYMSAAQSHASGSHYGGTRFSGSHYGGSQSGSQGQSGYQMVPGNNAYADQQSFASSKGSRSLANSAAIIPKAKFSWASESVGTQSTMLSRRSLASGSVPEPQHQKEGSKVVEGRMWASFAWILTFAIPNKCVMRPTKDAKQAWREKVALFVIMVSCSVFFVGVFGFVPLLLCKEDTIFSMQDVWLQTGENWVVVHGTIYDVKDLIYRHPGGVKGIVDYLGKDGSKVFPRAPPVTLPQKCLDMEKVRGFGLDVYAPDNNFTNPTCSSFSELDVLLGITCHTFAAGSNGTRKFLGDYERGVLSHTTVALNAEGIRWFALYERVYDVTAYIKAIDEHREPLPDGQEDRTLDNNPAAYLTPTLNKVIMNSLGGDATDLYEALFGSSEYIACLEEMFYVGLRDDEFDTFCYTLNIMMYVMLVFVATLMVIQFVASMIYICPRHHTYSEEDVMSPVMIMVPCYNEGDNELRKTIKSVLNTTYPDENKVLFMVADGMVTGNGEDMSTPEHLANILGFDIDEFEDDTFEYDCIGVVHTKNRARVYHGILQKGHKFLKYISVVKCGLPEEATTSAKPGNRGKRDSQLVIMGYYNRIHYGRDLTELDSAVQRAMVDLNLQADMVRFLMAIDADTRVDDMSITHMVYGMDKKEKVLALCGETKVDNKASSWVTMIQVFEYYNSHHLKKAFEAAFGCVTCLPGCFTMYRIIADDGTPLLPGDGVLYEYSRNDIETLHEKNLYHLGEDRMLTTLLLKNYPDRSLTFIPEAVCWTIVPHTFRILLSQRRRWINSTVHNMFELLRVNTMCGVCCVSMKVVVFIDLIATMVLPASYVYAIYLIFLVFFEDLPVSTVLLILYGIIMGVQVVVFILRSRWEYCWWFLIYFTIGLPVFYLILPTYSFWNMDDFSWGKTRAVGGSAAANAEGGEEEDDSDDSSDEESTDDERTQKKSLKGKDYLADNASIPSAARMEDDDEEGDGSATSGSSSDDDASGSEYESGSEYSESRAESEYFSQASKMQDRR